MARYCGLKKADELAGKRVKLTRECSNGNGSMPAGTIGIVDKNQFIRNGKISFTADKCDCCGFQWRVSGLCYDDLELVEKISTEHSEERSKWASDPDARKRLEVS